MNPINQIIRGDCLEQLSVMPANSVDLVFCSPPYEDARTYGIDFSAAGEKWVEWCLPRYLECLRVCRGLVAWVVEGRTRQYRWSATPAILMAQLHAAGVKLRKPPAFARVGIPGSGGPDWLRNDYEFIVCASHGKLPWSDNTAMGAEPKYAPGGDPSHRKKNGERVNTYRTVNGKQPDTKTNAAGEVVRQMYNPPAKANPGNVIRCKVGGGLMGSKLAHENEAPFPEALAEFFVRSFCPPGGVVLDPFCGSGTTLAVAAKVGRFGIGIDVRESQVGLSLRRVEEAMGRTPGQWKILQ